MLARGSTTLGRSTGVVDFSVVPPRIAASSGLEDGAGLLAQLRAQAPF